ncbi:hypothetical protein NE558_06540, partial [Anaerotignum propionicum]|nr:hypothetical protein [Anaerotignum propionicum]
MRNKIVAIFISISFILGSFSVEIAAQTKSGEGTETNPYIIETTEQLNSIREDITACYKLGSDIDLNNETWISISQFSGTLDGDGYVIRNLDTKGTGSFFANCQGTLKNIVLENVTATNGALVGNLTGTVDSCIAKGKISIQDGGGLVGYASGNASVKNSGVQGNLTVQGGTYGGGLIGNTYGSTVSVENCFVTGNLSI